MTNKKKPKALKPLKGVRAYIEIYVSLSNESGKSFTLREPLMTNVKFILLGSFDTWKGFKILNDLGLKNPTVTIWIK